MAFLILNNIITIVDASLIFYFVTRYLKNLKAGRKTIIFCIFLICIINNTATAAFGSGSPISSLIMIVSTGIVYKLIFREKLVNIYLFLFLSILLMFVAEATAILTVLPFGITPNMMHENFASLLIAGFISKMTYFLLVRYFIPRIKLLRTINKTLAYQIILVCAFNIIIIFMALWFYKNADMPLIKENSTIYIVLTTLGAVIFSLGILNLTKGIIKQSQKEAEWLAKEIEYKRQMFYVNNMEDMLKSIKAQKHDFINHISCIYGLLQLKKPEEAQKYIKKLSEAASAFNNIIDTGNPVLTAMLNTKIIAAERNKVKMNTDIRLPDVISIEPIDISIIIGNLLDNALEACAAVDKEDKSIHLEVYTSSNNLVIKLRNCKSEQISMDASRLALGFTSKQDAANHGFGLGNIKQAVSKYGGLVSFEDKGGSFHSNIAIPMNS